MSKKNYTDEFRRDAVALYRDTTDATVVGIATDLGISHGSLTARDVLEAAVIGVPDAKWGEIVIAYVQPRPGTIIDGEALTAHCKNNLSSYKRPTAIRAMETLPKNAVGKLDKAALRSIASMP